MTLGPGIEPKPHWWKASALITAPSLLPNTDILQHYSAIATQRVTNNFKIAGQKCWDTRLSPFEDNVNLKSASQPKSLLKSIDII